MQKCLPPLCVKIVCPQRKNKLFATGGQIKRNRVTDARSALHLLLSTIPNEMHEQFPNVLFMG